MDIYICGKKTILTPKDALSGGKGGEADIYRLTPGLIAKIFKPPNHSDYRGQPHAQKMADERIKEHQQKLPAFLQQTFPSCVVKGNDLIREKGGNIIGYSMPLVADAEVILKYSERKFREGGGISNDQITHIAQNLHYGITEAHNLGVVLGDALNDLNILIKYMDVFVIDADSTQFGPYLCKTFTAKFVDPLLCDPALERLVMVNPHTLDSDWYAFNVLLFQSWLYVAPYEGVYKATGKNLLQDEERPLKRISVFHPDVRYPKAAIHFEALTDDLLHHFQQVFTKDLRGKFPLKLIERVVWQTCKLCGATHCRHTCPICQTQLPQKHVTIQVRGQVTCERIFETKGTILHTAYMGNLLWLYHEGGKFKRETGQTFIEGDLDPFLRFRITPSSTFVGKGSRLLNGKEIRNIDQFGNLPIFDVNSHHLYWVENGRLMREDVYAPTYIGDILSGQSLFWVGEKFGFGFYRAGEVDFAFVFNAKLPGINNFVKLPLTIRGQLVDSTCLFSGNIAWFGVAYQDQGITRTAWTVIDSLGSPLAHTTTTWQDGSWAGTIRGKTPAGNYLFAATDGGLARITYDKSHTIFVDKTFPDTEPFINSGHRIQAGSGGIYAVSAHYISLVKIS